MTWGQKLWKKMFDKNSLSFSNFVTNTAKPKHKSF